MLKVTVNTKGLDTLARLAPGAAARAVERTAEGMRDRAKQLAPVRTGALRDSLATEQVQPGEWEVHDGVSYGVHVNFGAQGRPPNGFFSQALQEAEIRLPEAVAEAVNQAIREAD